MLLESEAIVLKVVDHGESDKIVTFFSLHHGKLTGIAKGAKRSKRRFVNKLEPFSHLHLSFAPNKHSSLVRIDEAELLDPFAHLRQDWRCFTCACLICELLLGCLAEKDPEQEVYQLSLWSLQQLASGPRPLTTLLLFNLHLFSLLGYHIDLQECQACGSENGPFTFSLTSGGLLCANCPRPADEHAPLPLANGTLRSLARARELPVDKWQRLSFSQQAVKEAMALFRLQSSSLLQRDIHSWRLLAQEIR